MNNVWQEKIFLMRIVTLCIWKAIITTHHLRGIFLGKRSTRDCISTAIALIFHNIYTIALPKTSSVVRLSTMWGFL